MGLSILPNGLSIQLQQKFFYVLLGDVYSNPLINIWIVHNEYVWVALKYEKKIPSDTVYLVLNSDALNSAYLSIGYTTANVYGQTNIHAGLPKAP